MSGYAGSMAKDDITNLHAAEEAGKTNHIYRITFEVLVEGSEDDEENSLWIFDELDVAAGADAETALVKLKEYVTTEQYGLGQIKGFRLKGIKLLAEAVL